MRACGQAVNSVVAAGDRRAPGSVGDGREPVDRAPARRGPRSPAHHRGGSRTMTGPWTAVSCAGRAPVQVVRAPAGGHRRPRLRRRSRAPCASSATTSARRRRALVGVGHPRRRRAGPVWWSRGRVRPTAVGVAEGQLLGDEAAEGMPATIGKWTYVYESRAKRVRSTPDDRRSTSSPTMATTSK